jgi:HTH-type transcriptional regulator / antitoxin HipB
MRSLKNLLQEKLENSAFREAFEKESRLADLAIQIAKRRERKGFTQQQLASRAHISQQQVSKVERAGVSGLNLGTLIRVCDALDLEIVLNPRDMAAIKAKPKKIPKSGYRRQSTASVAGKVLGTKKSTMKRAVHV